MRLRVRQSLSRDANLRRSTTPEGWRSSGHPRATTASATVFLAHVIAAGNGNKFVVAAIHSNESSKTMVRYFYVARDNVTNDRDNGLAAVVPVGRSIKSSMNSKR
jgi:anti-sigma-K factor RskA